MKEKTLSEKLIIVQVCESISKITFIKLIFLVFPLILKFFSSFVYTHVFFQVEYFFVAKQNFFLNLQFVSVQTINFPLKLIVSIFFFMKFIFEFILKVFQLRLDFLNILDVVIMNFVVHIGNLLSQLINQILVFLQSLLQKFDCSLKG